MECGVQSAMISVAPSGDSVTNQPLTTFPSSTDSDQAQFEADKRSVYKHPLFPLLALLFERCELATQSSDPQSSDAFNLDIQAFVQHQERDRKPFLANEPEIDGLMIKAIQVLRIHLLELEKVQELCKDFCNRYITCLKGKMQSENLLRSDYPQDVLGNPSAANLLNLENNNNNNNNNSLLSESGSASNSPVQYALSPPQAQNSSNSVIPTLDSNQSYYLGNGPGSVMVNSGNSSSLISNGESNLVIHGSTPLSQIGAGICASNSSEVSNSGPLSPAPTTPGGSADDCDSDFTSRGGSTTAGSSRKQKRGVLPKHATSVMRSWLFQHLVHPYPTEDEKRHIAAQTNLTLLQVNNWFINARRRILQPMLDASAPSEGNGGGGGTVGGGGSGGTAGGKKKKHGNNNRRFWPQDFASMQPQIDSGMLSSSDDEGDSYSSDGDEGSLVIDNSQNENINNLNVNQNGGSNHHSVDQLGVYSTNNSPENAPQPPPPEQQQRQQ